MVEDKALVALFLLGALAFTVALRMARYGGRNGAPKWEGIVFFPALFVWLGTPLTVPVSWAASVIAAVSVPLLIYGVDELRDAFRPERAGA